MKNNIVISIGRQFGSRGRYVGKILADKLGFKFYDWELLNLAAKEIGFDPSLFEKADEKPGLPQFMQNIGQLFLGSTPDSDTESYMSSSKMFEIQSEVIKKVADEGPCVIMGRCSDYVLRDNPNCISVFLTADMSFRIQCVKERTQLEDEQKIKKLIEHTDKKRNEYYNFYTGKEWGHSFSYDLCLDVSKIGVEATVEFIEKYLNAYTSNQK